jgi:hypothetical protein
MHLENLRVPWSQSVHKYPVRFKQNLAINVFSILAVTNLVFRAIMKRLFIGQFRPEERNNHFF